MEQLHQCQRPTCIRRDCHTVHTLLSWLTSFMHINAVHVHVDNVFSLAIQFETMSVGCSRCLHTSMSMLIAALQ